jgi:hypothetical protein
MAESGRTNKAAISFNGLMPTLEELVKGWKPEPMATETSYSNALAAHLRARLPEDARVEREYRHAGTTTDVGVIYKGLLSDGEVFFELKRNLKRKTDYDRLVGQIEGLKPRDNNIFVILVGDTDEALVGRLKEHCKPYTDRGFPASCAMCILVVK